MDYKVFSLLLIVILCIGIVGADSLAVMPRVAVPTAPVANVPAVSTPNVVSVPSLGNSIAPRWDGPQSSAIVSGSYQTKEAIVASCSVTMNPPDGVVRGSTAVTMMYADTSTGPVVRRSWYRSTDKWPTPVKFDSRKTFQHLIAYNGVSTYFLYAYDAAGNSYKSNSVTLTTVNRPIPTPTPVPVPDPAASVKVVTPGAHTTMIVDTSLNAERVSIYLLRMTSPDNYYITRSYMMRPGGYWPIGYLTKGTYGIKATAYGKQSKSNTVVYKNAFTI